MLKYLVNDWASILPYLCIKVLNARCEPEYIVFVDAWQCGLHKVPYEDPGTVIDASWI